MSTLWITLLLLMGASLQMLLPRWTLLGSMEWPLLTGLILCFSFRVKRPQLVYSILLAGFLYDSFSPAPLGISIPFFMLVGFGSYMLREEIFGDQLITYLILGLLAVSFKGIYFSIVFSLLGLRPLYAETLWIRLGGGFLLGSFITPLIYFLVFGLKRNLSSRRRFAR